MDRLWDFVAGYVLLPLGILLGGIWNTLGHPIATLHVLLALFDSRSFDRHQAFKIDRYYRSLTRESMSADLRAALVDKFYKPDDAIIHALDQAVSRWNPRHRWDRGPLHALFGAFAVDVVQAATGRKAKVWTEDCFAAFVASRLGDDSGAAPILWRSFCYNGLYPFTAGLTNFPAAEQQLDISAWVQAVALLATDAVDNVCDGRPRFSVQGPTLWYQFASFAARLGDRRRRNNDRNNCNSSGGYHPSVLEQVAFVAANQLPLDMRMRGPPLSAILPRVRKLVDEWECAPVSQDDFAIPFDNMVSLLGAVLQIRKLDSGDTPPTTRLAENRGLSMATDIDRSMHISMAKAILAVAGIHEDGCMPVSYVQFETLWTMFVRVQEN